MNEEKGRGPVLLVGAGPVAGAHARVLQHLAVDTVVVGRGEASATRFTEQTGLPVLTGELSLTLAALDEVPALAVVAVPVVDLADVTRMLVEAGVRDLLVEKPIGLDASEVAGVADIASHTGSRVYAAYNRRFHQSTLLARALAEKDGGVRSVSFEFTERSHVVAGLPSSPALKQAWLLANSSHVIDLAFHLAGAPAELHAMSTGALPWHDRGAAFAGCGTTVTGALFSYHADWRGPGGWGVELVTDHRRLLLKPLERLSVSDRAEPLPALHPADYSQDDAFKPGFLEQMRSFLGDRRDLLDIHAHLRQVREVIEPIRDGTPRGA